MSSLPKILWLTSWYPNRTDAFHGDFIERHAKAASLYCKLTVMVVVKDPSLPLRKVEVEKSVEENLTVYRVYYSRSSYGGIIEKIFSSTRYFRVQKDLYQRIVDEEGVPEVVHVHVAMKAGMLALWLKQQFNLPYLVTEHWTGYYPEAIPNIYRRNFIYRYLNRIVIERARLLLPVTKALGEMINSHIATVPTKVIANAVDTDLFFLKQAGDNKFLFIHPSSLNYQKNPAGILEACRLVKAQGFEFGLLMIGNKDEELVSLANRLDLQSTVQFFDAIPYPEVARQMQRSSALLLFSRFENLPCVILEALCCGLPVISSRVGGIEEVIGAENGILVGSEQVQELAAAMIRMMKEYNKYDRITIATDARQLYSFETIGHQLSDIYHPFLGKT